MFAYAGNNPVKYTDPDGRETGKEPECYIGPSTRKMSPQWWMKVDDAVTRFAWRNYGGLFLLPQEPNTIIRTMDGRLITLTESGVAFSNKEKVADCMFFCITFFALAAKLANASNAVSKTINISGAGEYSSVGGHHVHAKAAFKGCMSYDPKKGFSISQEFMRANGIDHTRVTATQRRLFKQLAQSGAPNSLAEHTRIALEALKAGGASPELAETLVNESLKNLAAQGVMQPTNIPWYDN